MNGKDPEACPWSILDVLVMTAVITVLAFFDPFHMGENILRFLRLHFFIFTREPKLLYYLTIYVHNILLKTISFGFLMLIIGIRGVSFWRCVILPGRIPASWGFWMPVYIAVCVLMHWVNTSNPLLPNIPFNSVFPESLILGNIVIVFSVIFVAPVVEEVLFRGFLYPAFHKYLGVWPAIIVTTALFTAAHYSQVREDYRFMVVIIILSLIITYAKERTGSTKLAIIMHGIYNFVCIGMGFFNYLIMKY